MRGTFQHWLSPLRIARVGDRQKAMDWLEKTYTERDGNLTLVKSYPDFKGLGGDPRFVNLLKRIGLPE